MELFKFMPTLEYEMWDNEALLLIPWLCMQSGGNNQIIREKVKNLIKESFKVYDKKGVLRLIYTYGLT